ncbi:hypothetical protein AB0E06_10405 [Streptomyces sp. NPDC048109]|uniref:hypothetical protein n=1 Tax=Streptomyces sp. NPDC048109 TaxID=3155482 RepID=UPI0034458203
MSDTPQTDDPMVAALLREREGYARRGMNARVAAVDEQLQLRGYKAPRRGTQKGQAESTASEQPKGRQQPAKSET